MTNRHRSPNSTNLTRSRINPLLKIINIRKRMNNPNNRRNRSHRMRLPQTQQRPSTSPITSPSTHTNRIINRQLRHRRRFTMRSNTIKVLSHHQIKIDNSHIARSIRRHTQQQLLNHPISRQAPEHNQQTQNQPTIIKHTRNTAMNPTTSDQNVKRRTIQRATNRRTTGRSIDEI